MAGDSDMDCIIAVTPLPISMESLIYNILDTLVDVMTENWKSEYIVNILNLFLFK